MCENLNNEANNEIENENQPCGLEQELTSGFRSALFRKINNVSIDEIRLQNSFKRFLRDVECGNSFTVLDIIKAAEWVVKGREPDVNAGNEIYSYDALNIANKRLESKLLKHSVGGIYILFSLNNGVAINVKAIGESVAAGETKRFLIVSPSKAAKYISKCESNNVKLLKVGEMLSSDKILLRDSWGNVSTIDKSVINSLEPTSVRMNQAHYNSYVAGYNALCSLVLCNCIAEDNILRFGLGEDVSHACARALGLYDAACYLKAASVRSVFVPDTNASVAISRPNVQDGDYLYFLKLRVDENGLPDKAHYGQLFYYLKEKKRIGIIKDVLPVGENTNRIIKRLCREDLEYVTITDFPIGSYGVIVSVGRGDSVNGIRLGHFKSV
jgi:hypothetical protein